ncbi:hypothetical protein IGI39_003635 [Enterococcus sp. AZ135]|uniref:winged helix-turn-helix domain-containing protein n=1 Tax=unclassified Enterococcus TaxID=2608891 RepID=UPI003F246093
MNILLLTNNILFEQDFIAQMNALGHEVLCSKNLLRDIQTRIDKREILKYFDSLIFSETICDAEVRNVIPVNIYNIPLILRKNEKEIPDTEKEEWKKFGISGFFSNDSSLDDFREILTNRDQKNELMEKSFMKKRNALLDDLDISLSAQEKQLFTILKELDGAFITREDICYRLWNSSPTNSMASRLSGIVKNLRIKIEASGFNKNCLVTSWGKGYRLKELTLKEVTITVPVKEAVEG